MIQTLSQITAALFASEALHDSDVAAYVRLRAAVWCNRSSGVPNLRI